MHARLLSPLAALSGVILVVSGASGALFYVDQSVASPGDGSSWETAFNAIQDGINAAEDGDEVIVAEGTYVETVDFRGKGITVRSKNPSDPGIVSVTVIEYGVSPEVVRFRSGESRSAVIAGFTIASGQVGIACIWASPVIRENIIVANTAEDDQGGGISCYYSSPLIEKNIIASNRAYLGGGGIACEGAEPIIADNLIIDNRTDTDGGGILCIDCRATIARNRIIANESQGNGGAISCLGSQPEILNNLIVSNVADSTGGAIASYSSVPRIVGNTIAHNSAGESGSGGIVFLDSSGILVNCILWGNGDDMSGAKATFSCIEDNEPQDQGEGNIHDDPAFQDPDGADNLPGTEDDDYRLSPGSPCMDNASFAAAVRISIQRSEPTFLLSWDPATDVAGQRRVSGNGPDIGCYESQADAAQYVLESSSDLEQWSLLHEGITTEFLLSSPLPGQVAFFQVSLKQQ